MRRNNSLGVLFAAAWMGLGVFPAAAAAATQIYHSVGPGNTTALATGNTLTVSGGTATFAYALPNTVGVGDAIQYDSNNDAVVDAICFIQSRIDPFQYTVQNNLGGAPVAASGATICAVYRAYNRLSRAESGAENTGIAAAIRNFDTWSGGRDLVANNEVWNIACYGDAAETNATTLAGWTTDNTHYLRIFTPSGPTESGTSQRHAGKWTASAYQISQANGNCLTLGASTNLELEGLQFYLTDASTAAAYGVSIAVNSAGSNVKMHGCLFRGPGGAATQNNEGLNFPDGSVAGNIYAWNNLAYDFLGPSGEGFDTDGTAAVIHYYNNTACNCTAGFKYYNGTVVLKNNLAQNCGAGFSGTFDSSSDYNLSDLNDAPGAHSRNWTAVVFVDEWNNDYHLASNDNGAKDFGEDLSADPNLAFTTDMDGESRSGSWDIGADEQTGVGIAVYPAAIYRSVGPGQTANLDSGGAGKTLSVSGNTATFSQALPNQVGVGDAVVYDGTSLGFLSQRNSSNSFAIVQKDGVTFPAATSLSQNWAIYRAYTALADVEGGNENTGIPAGVRNFDPGNTNLVSSRQVWNVACYAGSQADSTPALFDWVSNRHYYTRVYTPVGLQETGTSQRHAGIWSNSAYRLVVGNATALYFTQRNFRIEGLQIQITATNADTQSGIWSGTASLPGSIFISDNLVVGTLTSANNFHDGIGIVSGSGMVSIWNNLIYNFNGNANANGLALDEGWSYFVFNNTLVNCYNGIKNTNGPVTLSVINNVVQGAAVGFAAAAYSSDSDYNLSNLNDAPGTHSLNSATVAFVNSGAGDFHLSASDGSARDAGEALSANSNLAFSVDIDGETRPGGTAWDMGADEYWSGPTATPTTTSSPTLTLTYTLSPTPTFSASPTWTASLSSTATLTPSATSSHTPTGTPTPTSSPSSTSSSTASSTATPTPSHTLTSTASSTETATETASPTMTLSASPTWTASLSSTVTLTPSATLSHTLTETPTPTSSPSPTSSSTASFTETPSWTQTLTLTVSESATPTETASPFYTPTSTVTCTNTPTGTLSRTQTIVLSATPTGTRTLTLTATPSWTFSPTSTVSPTASPTASVSPTQVVPRPLLADLSSYPNPFWPRRETATIRYVLSANADVETEIFTYLGERVWRQTYAGGQPGGSGSPAGGENLIRWDGYGLSRGKLSSGGYILRVRAHAADGRTETGTCKIGLLGGD